VVWDREGEEGMRVIQRKGKGRRKGREGEGKGGREGKGREGKGREGKGGEEGRRRKMTWPPQKKIPGSATGQSSEQFEYMQQALGRRSVEESYARYIHSRLGRYRSIWIECMPVSVKMLITLAKDYSHIGDNISFLSHFFCSR
jgi:hypothetical protein